LQDILGDYDGTVLLVSHDRDFIDRVATATIAMEGNGNASVYPGGWSDYVAQRTIGFAAQSLAKSNNSTAALKSDVKKGPGLSFTERKRLEDLPVLMQRIEEEIGKLESMLEEPEMFTKDPLKFRKASGILADRQAALQAAEDEWMALADRA
jgi:ABC transport system ATP-binding/permease protein